MNALEIATATGGTVTERAIAMLIAAGTTDNKTIAHALGLCVRAVQKARKKTAERTTVREPQFASANPSSHEKRTPVRPSPLKEKSPPAPPLKKIHPSPDSDSSKPLEARPALSQELVSVASSSLAEKREVIPARPVFENGVQPDPVHGMLATIAGWYDAAWLPEERWKRAKRTTARLIALHGSPIVLAAVGELAAQIDDGVPVIRPVIVLEKVCQRLKANPPKPHVPPWEVEKRRRAEEFNRILRGEAVA